MSVHDIFYDPSWEGHNSFFLIFKVVGYGLAIATFALQEPMRWLTAKVHGAPRLLLADVYNLVSFIATVNIWRGMWGLMDEYCFPGMKIIHP